MASTDTIRDKIEEAFEPILSLGEFLKRAHTHTN